MDKTSNDIRHAVMDVGLACVSNRLFSYQARWRSHAILLLKTLCTPPKTVSSVSSHPGLFSYVGSSCVLLALLHQDKIPAGTRFQTPSL